MGLNIQSIKFLKYCKFNGADFTNSITLGRQSIHAKAEELNSILFDNNKNNGNELLTLGHGYCEPLFTLLGAIKTDSIDASTYEGATYIHDMNTPVNDALKEKYSALIDGGTLEHIFNFPVAIKNCMEMIQLNGHFIGSIPTNNFLGHGFYQFSPELFFRIFSSENGFTVKKMFFHIDHPRANWYEIKDPNMVKDRVILSNSYPAYLMVLAQRTEIKSIFDKTPQQSDYEFIRWNTSGDSSVNKVKGLNLAKLLFPLWVRNKISLLLYKIHNLTQYFNETGAANKRYFIKYKR